MPAGDETFLVKRFFLLCVLSFFWLPSVARTESPPSATNESELRVQIQKGRDWLTDDAQAQKLAGEAYNLGTNFLEDDQPGKAHAWLLFSKSLASKDPTIRHNLALAAERLGARIGKASVEPARAEWEGFISRSTLKAGLDLFFVFLIGLALGVELWKRLAPNTKHEAPGSDLGTLFPATWALFTVGVGLAGLGGTQLALMDSVHEAKAVLSEETVLRSGPGESYVALATISPGVVLPVESAKAGKGASSQGRWLKVRHAQGEFGWIPESASLPLSKNWP